MIEYITNTRRREGWEGGEGDRKESKGGICMGVVKEGREDGK